MRITADTKLADVALLLPYLVNGEEAKLCKAAEDRYLDGQGWWSITIADFLAMCDGDFSAHCIDLKSEDAKVLDYYFVKAFSGFVDEFSRIAGNLTPRQTADDIAANNACLPMTTAEGMLVFARRYFGCRSFDEAAGLKLADWLMARKDEYNRVTAERAAAQRYKQRK